MIVDNFLDTNILAYAADMNPKVVRKRETAIELINNIEFGLSAQVLQEFYSVVTTKMKYSLAPEQAFIFLDQLMTLPVIPIDQGIVTSGIQNSMKYQISYWDGAIIAAAEQLQCKLLYTEDLNHGQRYGSVEVRNPFK